MKSFNFQYLSRLDHLRFFACILMIFHHFAGDNIYHLTNLSFSEKIGQLWLINGSTGVSLFLVLSAFLFTLIAKGGQYKIQYSKFILNRILRIFPLTVFLVFIVIMMNRVNSTPMDIFRLLTLQLNTGNPITGWGHEFFPSGPIWTVAVEFQFYLIFPFLILFARKYGMKYLLNFIALIFFVKLLLVYMYNYNIYYHLYHTIIGRLDQFLVGIILGIFYTKGVFSYKNNLFYLALIIFPLILLTVLFWQVEVQHNTFLRSLVYFQLEALLWGAFIIGYLGFATQNEYKEIQGIGAYIGKTLFFLGTLSFSIYLFHLPVGTFVNYFLSLPQPNNMTESVMYSLERIPFILLFALISYYSIEKPFMDLRQKYLIKV